LTVLSIMECASPSAGSYSLVVSPHTASVANVAGSFDNLALYPNPSNGIMTLKGDLKNQVAVSIEIINTIGQVVYTEQVSAPGTELNHTIDLGNIPSGIYMLHINQD